MQVPSALVTFRLRLVSPPDSSSTVRGWRAVGGIVSSRRSTSASATPRA